MFNNDTDTTMADQPLTDVIPPPPDDAPMPIGVPSHCDIIKFADKIDPFDPTGDRTEMQLKFRRYVHTIALRSPETAGVRGYG